MYFCFSPHFTQIFGMAACYESDDYSDGVSDDVSFPDAPCPMEGGMGGHKTPVFDMPPPTPMSKFKSLRVRHSFSEKKPAPLVQHISESSSESFETSSPPGRQVVNNSHADGRNLTSQPSVLPRERTLGKRVHEIMKADSNKVGRTLSTRDSPNFCAVRSWGRGIRKDDKQNMLRRPTSTVFQEGVRAETRRPFSATQVSDVRRSGSRPVSNDSREASGSDMR